MLKHRRKLTYIIMETVWCWNIQVILYLSLWKQYDVETCKEICICRNASSRRISISYLSLWEMYDVETYKEICLDLSLWRMYEVETCKEICICRNTISRRIQIYHYGICTKVETCKEICICRNGSRKAGYHVLPDIWVSPSFDVSLIYIRRNFTPGDMLWISKPVAIVWQ